MSDLFDPIQPICISCEKKKKNQLQKTQYYIYSLSIYLFI